MVGLILYHRERCNDPKTCFCTTFDDSLTANRIIMEESKAEQPGALIREEDDNASLLSD